MSGFWQSGFWAAGFWAAGFWAGDTNDLAAAMAAGRRSRAEPETVLEREAPPVAGTDMEADDEEALIFMLTAWLAAEGAT